MELSAEPEQQARSPPAPPSSLLRTQALGQRQPPPAQPEKKTNNLNTQSSK